jgi:hypothetical protein
MTPVLDSGGGFSGETMDSGLVGQLARGQNQGRGGASYLEEAGWWYRMYRRLRKRDVYTANTRMEHMGNGE